MSKAEPRFDRDLKYGVQGELQINDFLEWVASGNAQVETKRKRYLDHKLYVETDSDPGRRGYYTPSGINVTTAALWCFVIGDTGCHVAIPTELLRQMLTDPSSRPVEEEDGGVPTRGMLIDFCVLLYRQKQRGDQARHATAAASATPRPADPAPALTARDIPWKGRS
jgi:hypothetical protein